MPALFSEPLNLTEPRPTAGAKLPSPRLEELGTAPRARPRRREGRGQACGGLGVWGQEDAPRRGMPRRSQTSAVPSLPLVMAPF